MNGIDYPVINNWYDATFTEGYRASSGGGSLRYSFRQGDSQGGTIIIVPGRTEFIEKYRELCWDLRELGCSFCVYDHLGQGKSTRLINDSQKGYIHDFDTYVEDLKDIVNSVALQRSTGPVWLLAHSMGGTISALATQNGLASVKGLLLVSPMFQINTGKLHRPLLAELLCTIVSHAGGRTRYVWGSGRVNPSISFKNNVLTTDSRRFSHNLKLITENPDMALGGPTFGWLHQAFRAMRSARKQAGEIDCSTMIFRTADERVVGLPEMEQFCEQVRRCQLVTYRDCQHELLMEKNEIRNDLLGKVRKFLKGAT